MSTASSSRSDSRISLTRAARSAFVFDGRGRPRFTSLHDYRGTACPPETVGDWSSIRLFRFASLDCHEEGLLPASSLSRFSWPLLIRIDVRLGRFFDTCSRPEPVSIRAWIIRWAPSLDRIAFKEEVRGSNPALPRPSPRPATR